MTSKRVSLSTIAKQLGVSIATVSRALNNHPAISDSLKLKVRALAEELCYIPNAGAVNLKSGKRNAIGVIVPNINRNFFSAAIEGIEDQASQLGMDVLISHSKDSAQREERMVQLLAGKVDGIIASLAADQTDHAYYNRLHRIGIPLVLFDRVADNITASKVFIDDAQGMFEMTNHFLEQGLRKIYHFAGPQFVKIWENRKMGYLRAMASAGISVDDDWICEMPPIVENGRLYANQLADSGNLPEAIAFTGDYAALGAISEFKRRGIDVPRQIAISGFANEPYCQFVAPTLSSVDQSSRQMGARAFQILMDNINGEAMCETIIKPKLVIRESSIGGGGVGQKAPLNNVGSTN